jgi:cytochrome c oxidase subunit 2
MRNQYSSKGVAIALLALGLNGCGGNQSALNPQGVEADRLASLIWFFTAVCGAVWILVLAILLVAILRRRSVLQPSEPLQLDEAWEKRTSIVVGGLVAITTVILVVFTISSYLATRTLAAPGEALAIEVTGHQWWWNVKYDNPDPTQVFETANELHVPVGKPVRLDLKAADVIHSFWVPSLTGKQDLIPGQENILSFTAKHPGKYRGQCAEFCGWQHAHMAFFVVVDSPDDFQLWRVAQLKGAKTSAADGPFAGAEIFMQRGCALCHTVRGTPAGGRTGPDLTHIAGRSTIAAGTLVNTSSNLKSWIAHPQKIKPGSKMPEVPLTTPELDALVAYLGSLD